MFSEKTYGHPVTVAGYRSHHHRQMLQCMRMLLRLEFVEVVERVLQWHASDIAKARR